MFDSFLLVKTSDMSRRKKPHDSSSPCLFLKNRGSHKFLQNFEIGGVLLWLFFYPMLTGRACLHANFHIFRGLSDLTKKCLMY
jgi:hypothetical protein